MVALDSYEAVQNAFVMAKEDLSEILSGMSRSHQISMSYSYLCVCVYFTCSIRVLGS